ncbi:trafficking protein particle complex subunit 11 [Anaeramoeba ignava]|uniref:Trafficking protein particle complex subunit 11 n=1 Tax=Anaeramoeba ignava TaxID=1746090 RepID=A0A9Q0R5Y7_ANAIG|nr:trafficking protein particle complex subunit 11 [Anaeramoeba ignava]
MFYYPTEILAKPIPLVGLSGDQETQNLIQKNFAKKFHFVSFTQMKAHKRKTNISRENYIPEGILKADWLIKHFYTYPVVTVSCYILDLNEWQSKEKEIVDQIHHLNESSKLRNMKFIILLVIPSNNTIANEILEEKIISLKRKGELEAKKGSILIYSSNESEQNLKRVEYTIHNFAARLYKEEIRNIKKYQDNLNKKTQAKLIARHQFKCGFYSECRSETKNAIKYYKKAYQEIKEITPNKQNFYEIKILLEILMIKMIKLFFSSNNVIEGLDEFRKHIQFFIKFQPESQDTIFIDYSSISHQYSAIAKLLEKFDNRNLSPQLNPWHNIGFYYSLAGEYALKRYNLVKRLIEIYQQEIDKIPKSQNSYKTYYSKLFDLPSINFIGQSNNEFNLLQELIAEENIPQSSEIIQLFERAFDFYSRQTPHSDKLLLTFEMKIADQLFEQNLFAEVVSKLKNIPNKIRKEKWSCLLLHPLDLLMECGIKTNDKQLFLISLLTILSPELNLKSTKRNLYFQKLKFNLKLNSFKFNIEPLNPSEVIVISTSDPFFNLIDLRIHFTKSTIFQNQKIILKSYFCSHFPKLLSISKLEFFFNEQTHNFSLEYQDIDNENEGETLILLPDTPKILTFELQARKIEQIQCTGVVLCVGKENISSIKFHWNPLEISQLEKFDPISFPQRPTVYVIRPEPRMKIRIKSDPPPLVHEYYPIEFSFSSHEDHVLSGEYILIATGKYDKCRVFRDSPEESVNGTKINIPEIPPNCTHKEILFFRSEEEVRQNFQLKVEYETKNNYKTATFIDFILSFQTPFKTDFQFFSPSFEHTSQGHPSLVYNHKFFLSSSTSIEVPTQMEISKFSVNLSKDFTLWNQESIENDLDQNLIHKGHRFSNLFCLNSLQNAKTNSLIPIGNVEIQFKRKNLIFHDPKSDFQTGQFPGKWNQELLETSIFFPIPKVVILKKLVTVSIEIPHEGYIGEEITCKIEIQNNSSNICRFSFEIENKGSFFFSGFSSTQIHVLPRSIQTINYNFLPLLPGLVQFPWIRALEYFPNGKSKEIPEISKKSSIFIYPFTNRIN